MTGQARRCVLIGVAGLVAATGMGVAQARLAAYGTGAGTAPTGAPRPVTLAPGTVGRGLYPGGSAPVTFVASNPNPGPVRLGRLALDPSRGTAGLAVDAAHPGCTTGGLLFTPSDAGGSGWTVPGGGSLAITLDAALTADATFSSACQGATLTVHLTAS